MKRVAWFTLAVLGTAPLINMPVTEAGFFSKKSSDNCESCEEAEPKKKSKCCCIDLADPPRAGTATAMPAVITNQRATRQPAPAAAPASAPAAANSCTTGANMAADTRMDQLTRDVNVLKEQIRVLSALLQQANPPAPPAPAPMP